jgi:hypothetical protein
MSLNRVTRNEAWIVSLVVHAALLAGLIALWGLPRETRPAIETRSDGGYEVGVITLVEPVPATARAAPAALSTIAVAHAQPVIQPPPPPGPVRVAAHQNNIPTPIPTTPGKPLASQATSLFHPAEGPVPHASGSDASSSKTPAAVVPGIGRSPAGSPSDPLPAGAVTAFFGVPAVGKSVVFVLDRSASMGLAGRLDSARWQLAASLRRLPTSARFQVIAYNRSVEPVRVPGTNGLLPATPDVVESVIATVGRMPAEGSTDHAAALTAALALGPDVIYFLTDEDDLDLRDVQAVTRRNHGRACIHAICLTMPTGETPMCVLARENRGQFLVRTWCQVTTSPPLP